MNLFTVITKTQLLAVHPFIQFDEAFNNFICNEFFTTNFTTTNNKNITHKSIH